MVRGKKGKVVTFVVKESGPIMALKDAGKPQVGTYTSTARFRMRLVSFFR